MSGTHCTLYALYDEICKLNHLLRLDLPRRGKPICKQDDSVVLYGHSVKKLNELFDMRPQSQH